MQKRQVRSLINFCHNHDDHLICECLSEFSTVSVSYTSKVLERYCKKKDTVIWRNVARSSTEDRHGRARARTLARSASAAQWNITVQNNKTTRRVETLLDREHRSNLPTSLHHHHLQEIRIGDSGWPNCDTDKCWHFEIYICIHIYFFFFLYYCF